MSYDIVQMLNEPKMTTVCAPMVRYSRLQFRNLVRKYNCDICFTPMILADSFVQSLEARNNDFVTNKFDKPLVVQFAAKRVDDFVAAAELVSQYSSGIDLNCGCPQRWAMKDGYGADLLNKPELVKDLIYQVRNRILQPFSVSVKIRLLKDLRKTIEFCKILEKAGVSFVTVHARTPQMRKEPIDLDGLKIVRECLQIPVIANGGVKNLNDAKLLYEESKCNGVMSASGILTNPALFSGHNTTPISCIQNWLDITSSIPTQFLCMHHHLVFMLEKVLPIREKRYFNNLHTKEDVISFIKAYFGIIPNSVASNELYNPTKCEYKFLPTKNIKKKDNFFDNDSNSIFLENLFST